MNGVDVMADKYGSVSPYNYAFNNPVVWNDPNGADPLYPEFARMMYGAQMVGGRVQDSGTAGWNGSGIGSVDHITPGSGGNWSDPLRSMSMNAGLMFGNDFNSFYGIRDNESRFHAAQEMAQGLAKTDASGKLVMFNPWLGRLVREDRYAGEWVAFDPTVALKIISKGYKLFRQQGGPDNADDIKAKFGGDFTMKYEVPLLGVDTNQPIEGIRAEILGIIGRNTVLNDMINENGYQLRAVMYSMIEVTKGQMTQYGPKEIVPSNEWTMDPLWPNPGTLAMKSTSPYYSYSMLGYQYKTLDSFGNVIAVNQFQITITFQKVPLSQ
jgi:hypothetical protein